MWLLSETNSPLWLKEWLEIQGYYKRNRQFQHFIKPKLFKISTLMMLGFVEKLWKFVTAI
jgi:hypothetical protein